MLFVSLPAKPAFAAPLADNPTPTPELGWIKICKVAGSGVVEGQLFTISVNNTSYSVPAGPGSGGYCVLAGQYPVNSEVTVQESIPFGYYVSYIEVKPYRVVSRNTSQGTIIVRVGSGVTEVIYTNKVIGSPTPTRTPTAVVTSTPKPTKTPTATPDCGSNCTPTPTPIPRGRLQICKESDGSDVAGYFTFRFNNKSVSVPVGACSGLIGVNAGSLTITEDAKTGYSVSDIYTIPANRLIGKDTAARSATVTIVEGNAATQTIVIFRNRYVPTNTTSTPTSTPTNTSTSTPTSTSTSTGTPPTNTPTYTPTFTPTNTPTVTGTPPMCQPEVVVPNFGDLPVGSEVDGLGIMDPRLNIDAKGTAIHVHEGMEPSVYASTVNGVDTFNAGMVGNGGFSDAVTQALGQAHLYTFSFAPGVAISNFSLHMLDYGDYNPTSSGTHLVTMTAYNASGGVVTSQTLSFTSVGGISPEYGNLALSGDATTATSGQPGNWKWNVSGNGIVRVVLEFGVGYDPNIGFDSLSFTIDCP